MVQYLASTATTQINVITSEVATILTISAVPEVVQGEPFTIEGTLRRADTMIPLSGELISLSFNGTSLGTTTTRDTEGVIKYMTTVQIDTVGIYTLTANFAGSTRPGLTLRPSQGIWSLNVGDINPLIPFIPLILGVVLLVPILRNR